MSKEKTPKLSRDEICKLIPELFEYNAKSGTIFNKKRGVFENINDTYIVPIHHESRRGTVTAGIIAHFLMTNEFPKFPIYRLDKAKGFVWDNLSKSPPMIRRNRIRTLPKGVSLRGKSDTKNKYNVTIYLDKLYSLGNFSNIDDAKLAYDICLKRNEVIKFAGRYKNAKLSEFRNSYE